MSAFKCPKCGAEVNSVVFLDADRNRDLIKKYTYLCSNCHNEVANKVKVQAPAIHGCDSFNPHYDVQVDKFFESADQKKKWLKEKGFTQVAGQLSPRKNAKGMIICNKSQGKRMESHND